MSGNSARKSASEERRQTGQAGHTSLPQEAIAVDGDSNLLATPNNIAHSARIAIRHSILELANSDSCGGKEFGMASQDAFITLLNANIEIAVEHKQTALSLIDKAETAQNKQALIAAEAAAYRADKAIAVFEDATTIPQQARAAVNMEAGLVHLDMCERHLQRASDLLFRM